MKIKCICSEAKNCNMAYQCVHSSVHLNSESEECMTEKCCADNGAHGICIELEWDE